MGENIVFIGFMGTGKTAVGRQVASQLGYEFLDTDHLIETQEGIGIPEIFSNYGEPYFRQLEKKVAAQLVGFHHTVISTGGGFPLNPENLSGFRSDSMIVLLTAEPEIIFQRVQGQTERPLLSCEDPLRRIKELLAERAVYYQKADLILDTSFDSPEEVSRKVIAEWQKRRLNDGADRA